jgi:hypothetical protein
VFGVEDTPAQLVGHLVIEDRGSEGSADLRGQPRAAIAEHALGRVDHRATRRLVLGHRALEGLGVAPHGRVGGVLELVTDGERALHEVGLPAGDDVQRPGRRCRASQTRHRRRLVAPAVRLQLTHQIVARGDELARVEGIQVVGLVGSFRCHVGPRCAAGARRPARPR